MSDLDARLALLAQETPEFEDGKRILPGRDRFAALIHLIDQTVIPAILRVEDDSGSVELEVAGRRLCRILGVVDGLTSDDSDAITKAAEHLADFADAGTSRLRVEERASSKGAVDPTQSVSISTLASAAGRKLIDTNAPPLKQFQERLGTSLMAALILKKGAVSDTIGDDKEIASLKEDVASLFALATDESEITVFDLGETVRGSGFVGDDGLVFTAKMSNVGDVVALFNESFGR